jgi:tetratricopeptide (TPR) repeat protein
MMLLSWVLMVGCGPKNIALAPPTQVQATGLEQTVETVEQQLGRASKGMLSDGPTGWREAAAVYSSLAAADVTEDVLINLGVAQMFLGEHLSAESSFKSATKRFPEVPEGWLYYGVALEHQGETRKAIRVYRAGIEALPEDRDLRVAQVSALRRAGDVKEAQKAATEALRLDANNLSLYNNVGLAYLESGDPAMARFVFQKANGSIAGAENDAAVQCNLGRSFFALGDSVTARAYIERSLELDPQLLPALLSYSQMLLEDRAYLEAIPLLERAVEYAPENSSLLVNLGAAYRGVGRGEEAIEVTERAAAIAPSSGPVVFNLGLLYGDVRLDYEKAISMLNQYTTAVGPASLRANSYIESFEKSKDRAVKKRAAESVNRQRDIEIAERALLLEEAAREEAEKAQQSTPPAPEPAPAAEPEITPSVDDPWGTAK